MSRRVKTAAVSLALLLGCAALALLVVVLGAREERVDARLEVVAVRELGDGRVLVRLVPPPVAGRTLFVSRIVRYPLGLAVVQSGEPTAAAAATVTVRTARVAPGPVRRTVFGFGTVEAVSDARIAVQAAGVVSAVALRLGAEVQAGASLVELDARERAIAVERAEAELARARAARAALALDLGSLQEQLAHAEAALELRTRERDRWHGLHGQGIASSEQAEGASIAWQAALAERDRLAGALRVARAREDEADAAVALAGAARAAAALELERCVVRAPFAGFVAERLVEVGEYVLPGTPVARLADHRRARVRLHVREADALAVRPDAPAAVTVPGVDLLLPADGIGDPAAAPFTARVEGVAAAADPATRTFAVDVVVENTHGLLRPGMFARVEVEAGVVADALLVPDGAVVQDELGDAVFVVEGDVARRRPVVLGPRQGSGRLLRAGLDGPAEVVVDGTALLFDGAGVVRLPDGS